MGFLYPTNRELITIGPEKVARLTPARLGFTLMPMRRVNAGIIQWQQRDNYRGLQQLRGLDGSPNYVKPVGNNLFSYTPGVFGEYGTVTETELMNRAGSVSADVPIDVTDLVTGWQDLLIQRELDRIEQIIWTLLSTGTFSVSTPSTAAGQGTVAMKDTFTLQTQSRAVDWDTVATATPLVDIRAVQAKGLGKGVSFGASAMAILNRVTLNKLLSITNTSDIGGRRTLGGGTINSLAEINRILNGEDLPALTVYDEGYYTDANIFTKFVPDDKVIFIGSRTSGEKIGEYLMTRNISNPGYGPGSYDFVRDRTGNAPDGQKYVPANMEIHRGHNGGPAIYFPGSICILSV